MSEVKIEQLIFLPLDEDHINPITNDSTGLMKISSNLLDATFGVIGDIDSVELWIHEMIELTISNFLKDYGFEFGTIEAILGTENHLWFEWMNLELYCSIDHLITTMITSTYLPTENGWIELEGDEFWNSIIMNQFGRMNDEF